MGTTFTKFLTMASLGALFSAPLFAADSAKPDVMMMGTFHFANPQADTVKTKQMNVTTSENQQYLEALSKSIGQGYKPTHVLLECQPKDQAKYDERYAAFIKGDFTLPVNENYQLGFRIASESGLDGVVCYDERGVNWQAGPMMEHMNTQDSAGKARFDAKIKDITQLIEGMHMKLSLPELLSHHNSGYFDNENMSLYLLTNDVGSKEKPVGADAAASWWHRNFRMYANVQRVAQNGTRVFVLGGQGHTAVMKQLLSLDQRRTSTDINSYLKL